MSAAVELVNVTKRFQLVTGAHRSLKAALLCFKRAPVKELLALNDISLSIEQGETVAIIGRNGSGKSTMLRIIGRVYRQTGGSVHVNGRMSTMLDLGAGFHPELTGRENIFFNGAIMGLSTPQVKNRLEPIIEFSELSDFIDTPVKTYSAGMLMRLGFAIAVETDPDILLIDEVLAVGDAAFQEKCYRRIDSFKSSGKTIIFVTHDLQAARMVASRTIWLDKGDLKMDGDTSQTIEEYLEQTT